MAITSSKISLVFPFSGGDQYIYLTVIAYYTGFMYCFSYLFNKIYIRDTHTHTERERERERERGPEERKSEMGYKASEAGKTK